MNPYIKEIKWENQIEGQRQGWNSLIEVLEPADEEVVKEHKRIIEEENNGHIFDEINHLIINKIFSVMNHLIN